SLHLKWRNSSNSMMSATRSPLKPALSAAGLFRSSKFEINSKICIAPGVKSDYFGPRVTYSPTCLMKLIRQFQPSIGSANFQAGTIRLDANRAIVGSSTAGITQSTIRAARV
ncbi:MAG: hypothetical protein WCJ09_26460, partial [Planctomycetota bacterium]